MGRLSEFFSSKNMKRDFSTSLALVLALGIAASISASAWAQSRQEMVTKGADVTVDLFTVHKPAVKSNGRPPVLLLHPFGAPCADGYDLPDYSWMDYLSKAGFDTWAIDFKGFARSSHPQASVPANRAKESVEDVKAVVQEIKRRTGTSKVSLLGWSWGGVVAAMTAIDDANDIDRLVLVGTMHGFVLPMMTDPLARPGEPTVFGPVDVPYQRLDAKLALAHWRMMLKGIEGVASPDAVQKAEALMHRCGNVVEIDGKMLVTRPMGPLQDLFEIWVNRPIFDPTRIKVPTLVLRGDHDIFADAQLAPKIPRAQEVVVPDATHWGPFEKGSRLFWLESEQFLK